MGTTAILLLTLLASTRPASSDCNVNEVANDNPCGGRLTCRNDLSDALSDIEQMPCLYIYNDYSEERFLHMNFSLSIEATDFDFNANDSLVINELKDHINNIAFTNGRIKKFPDAILNLRHATVIDLSSNQIESLNLAALPKPSMLNVLNMSYNNIGHLDVLVGSANYWLVPVTTIDLSHNNIRGVLQYSIPPYATLKHLNLSYNYIESCDDNTFSNLTDLITLDLSNNRIWKLGSSIASLGSLQELFLDHNYLISLTKANFNSMNALRHLNISSNSLKSIPVPSFSSLFALEKLDISYNHIKVISKSTFQNNSLLCFLDVSYNMISKIESGAFAGAHIENLKLHNNTLAGYLDTDAFNGLYFEKLDLSDADISELGPHLFGPHPTFQSLNFSKNVISKISKATFRNLNYLSDLDLSYNKLQSIDFDTTDLRNLTNFYLNNNAIEKIGQDTFEPLTTLRLIDLSNNAIKNIEPLSFANLKVLNSLNLKNNPLSNIAPQSFGGLNSCYTLDLSGTNIKTLRNNSFNEMRSLNVLNLSSSNIKLLEFDVFNGTRAVELLYLSNNQIESFSVNNLNLNLQQLMLNSNNITSLNKGSFKNMRKLTFMDISNNKISNIQPGSFTDCEYVHVLNLTNNYLSFLQYGVFQGLQRAIIIDLSNNRFHRFDGKLLYNIPDLMTLYLDNNYIDKVNFSEFNVRGLSIGGNLITCNSLTQFKSERGSLSLSARYRNLDTENVDGITCRSDNETNNTAQKLESKISLNDIEKLMNTTNRYLAANFGALLCGMLIVLCIFVYFKFRNKLSINRTVSSSREVLSNSIELE